MIDTHMHLLDPARFPYPARTAGYRPQAEESGSFDDLFAVMEAQDIEKAVLVQPSVYGGDNAAILEAVAAFPGRFRGIAGPPADAAGLASLGENPGITGIRLNLIAFKGETLGARRFEETLKAAADVGLAVQVLAPCRLLAGFAAQIEGAATPVIIDHLGAPDTGRGPDDDDFRRVMQLARNPLVHMKLSAAFRYLPEAAPWPSLAPYVSAIVEAYGPEQLLWGSDWPFINLCGHPKPSYAATLDWLREAVDSATLARMQETAVRLFGFGTGEAAHG